MASKEAWGQVRSIVESLDLERLLPADVLDNLKGRIAAAVDSAWQQGFSDCEMQRRLLGMDLHIERAKS